MSEWEQQETLPDIVLNQQWTKRFAESAIGEVIGHGGEAGWWLYNDDGEVLVEGVADSLQEAQMCVEEAFITAISP